jgi:hypothetical protein
MAHHKRYPTFTDRGNAVGKWLRMSEHEDCKISDKRLEYSD